MAKMGGHFYLCLSISVTAFVSFLRILTFAKELGISLTQDTSIFSLGENYLHVNVLKRLLTEVKNQLRTQNKAKI